MKAVPILTQLDWVLHRFKVRFLPTGVKVSDQVKELYRYYRNRAQGFGTLAAI